MQVNPDSIKIFMWGKSSQEEASIDFLLWKNDEVDGFCHPPFLSSMSDTS